MRPTLNALALITAVSSLTSCNLLKSSDGDPGAGATSDQVEPSSQAEGNTKVQEALKKAESATGLPGLGGLADAVKGLQGIAEEQGKELGPAVHWKELAPFVPETVTGFDNDGELDAKTTKLHGFEVSVAKRSYKADNKRLTIEILDTSAAAMLRTPFAMAQMLNEDSTQGYKKGAKVAAQPAIVEWNKARKRSHTSLLAGGRFLVNVTVTGAGTEGEAEKIASSLKLSQLGKLTAEAK